MTVQIKPRAADRAPTRDRGDGAYSIAPDLAYLRLSIVNIVYSACKVMATVVWVLIDAGLPTSQGSIIHVKQKRFGSALPASYYHTDAWLL
jgi:hypothetical protein